MGLTLTCWRRTASSRAIQRFGHVDELAAAVLPLRDNRRICSSRRCRDPEHRWLTKFSDAISRGLRPAACSWRSARDFGISHDSVFAQVRSRSAVIWSTRRWWRPPSKGVSRNTRFPAQAPARPRPPMARTFASLCARAIRARARCRAARTPGLVRRHLLALAASAEHDGHWPRWRRRGPRLRKWAGSPSVDRRARRGRPRHGRAP
jgi:hypothetical protein